MKMGERACLYEYGRELEKKKKNISSNFLVPQTRVYRKNGIWFGMVNFNCVNGNGKSVVYDVVYERARKNGEWEYYWLFGYYWGKNFYAQFPFPDRKNYFYF